MKKLLWSILGLFIVISRPAVAADARVELPPPDTKGGKPLMQALAERHSIKTFLNAEPLTPQMLSDVLWAAWGINRPDGRRTVPTAMNRQNVEVYAVKADGVWRYDAKAHALLRVLGQNLCANFGDAPLTLLYAARTDDKYAGMHVGSMYQNAGLYAASAELGNVVRAAGADVLEDKVTLPHGYNVLMTQSFGR